MTDAPTLLQWQRAVTDSDLPATTKLVLFVLSRYANAFDSICWPSNDTLAEKASLSVRAISKHLGIAERFGWVARWKSRRPDRQWAHGHYRLAVPSEDAAAARIAPAHDEAVVEVVPTATDSVPSPAPRSGDNRNILPVDSTAVPVRSALPSEPESYRNDVPTNYPVNRNTKKQSLSQTSSVNHAKAGQREKPEKRTGALARWMAERLAAKWGDAAPADVARWERDIAAMQCDDGRAEEQIVRLFSWALGDKFWQGIVTSPAKLRRHWDELRRRRNIALEAQRAGTAPTSAPPAADDRRCAHVTDGCRCAHAATTLLGAGQSRRGYCRQHIGYYDE